MPAPDDTAAIKSKLNVERIKLLESFANLPTETMHKPLGPEGWSIKDILAHVAVAEGVNVKFARIMVERDSPVQLQELAADFPDYPGEFELDTFNAWMARAWQTKSLDEVILALHTTRAQTMAWLDTLTPEQLDRSGTHAVWGTQTVRGLFRILVIHDRAHRGDIEKRAQVI